MAFAGVLTASKAISQVVRQAWSLHSQLEKAKSNKKEFKVLEGHVKDITKILETLEQQGVEEGVVKTGLEIFGRALESADKLLQDYGHRNKLMCLLKPPHATFRFSLKARSFESSFTKVDDQLSKSKQHLTLVLQVEHRGQSQVNESQKKKKDDKASADETLQRVLEVHKSSLLKKFDYIFEGLQQRGSKTPLEKIYTQLYITEGESDEVNKEHEIKLMDKLVRNTTDTPINCTDIFRVFPGQSKYIRTVMTKGIAGIGKTVSVRKFVVDWADKRANHEIQVLVCLPLRELNLLQNDELSLHSLMLKFHPELKPLTETYFSDMQIVFIFDGIDESRLPLDFHTNKPVGDLMEIATLDVLVTNLIKGNLLQSARIWMTSRPAAAGQIPCECIDRITEVRGFKNEQREEYFRKRIPDPVQADQIISHIKTTRTLYIMCHIPVFCYIVATVLQEMLGQYDSKEIPSTLTEMYIYFMIIQLDKKKQKYDAEKSDKINVLQANRNTILKLAELAFNNLEQGTIVFDEDYLKKCHIHLDEASVHSGFCTEILREESKFALKTFYCFVHLSLQEFLAALFVFVSFMNEEDPKKTSKIPKELHLYLSLKSEVDKSLQSKNGHWDLFLRFLLGISLQTSWKLLQGLLTCPFTETHREEELKSLKEKIVKYIRNATEKSASPERSINLINCLSEMKDHSIQNELQRSLTYEKRPDTELSPLHCSALADVLLKSEEPLDEFDIDKYNTSEEGRQRIVPVVKWCRISRFTNIHLNEQSCEILSSVLQSRSSNLRELHLNNTTMPDSGMKAVYDSMSNPNCVLERLSLVGCKRTSDNMFVHLGSSLKSMREDTQLVDLDLSCCSCDKVVDMNSLKEGLKNRHCKVERLSLRKCDISSSCCQDLAAIICSASNLKKLDLRDNNLQDSGVKCLSSALKSLQCTLDTLRLSPTNLTEASWRCLTSVFQGELDLSESRLLMSELEQLSAALRSPDCRLNSLRLNQCFLKDEHCGVLASLLSSEGSHLKELNLNNNDLQDSGVELLSSGLKSSQCTLEILRLSFCGVTGKGCEFLASALSANPSSLRELDLSYNHPGETGVKLLSERKDDPDCKLDKLNVDHEAECWLKSGLKKYACMLWLDPNTSHYEISVSEDQRFLTAAPSDKGNPDHPDRFKFTEQVLCTEGLTGRYYWEAELYAKMPYVGAAYRKQGIEERDCRLGLNNTSWGLLCEDVAAFNRIHKSCSTASHDSKASPKVLLTFHSDRVGVFLDWEAGTLSFYSVSSDTLTHLHTFHHRFTEPIYPGFGLVVPQTSFLVSSGEFISLCQV